MTDKQNIRRFLIRFLTLAVALQLLVFPFAALAAPAPTSICSNYLLEDVTSGDILIAKKADERIFPASTTKIMTALLLIENESDLSKTVTVGDELDTLEKDSSVMGLKKGEVISYKDLLYGLMLPSGGDAASTVAVHIGGSIAGFADMMNQKAAALGMTGTHFTNPHGLQDSNHYSTASDLAKMTIAALNYPIFRTVVSTPTYKTASTNKHPNGLSLANTNKLISTTTANKKYNYQYAIGVKTGFTNEAHGCLVAAAEKDGRMFVAVMMGDNSASDDAGMVKRFTDSVKFFEYGFTQQRIDLFPKIKGTKLSTVLPGDKDASGLTAIIQATEIIHWMDADIASQLSGSDSTLDVAYALDPVSASPKPTGGSTVVGKVTYSYQGVVLYSCDVIKTPVEKPPQTDQTAAFVKLVALILLGMAVLILILLILRRVTNTRSQRRRRYRSTLNSNRNRNKGSRTRLRNPHDYR